MREVSDAAAADFLSSLLDPPATPAQQAGNHIGPYVLVEKLGDGGFGTVWLARQEQPVRRRVALKILKLGMDTVEVIFRFEQERQALALMEHPNIARVLDAGATVEGRPYFAMELVDGISITRYCREKSLPIEDRLRIFLDVCAGVEHAHQKGIIHRDLKPANILITESHGAPLPKIIDFGIAKATAEDHLSDGAFVTRIDQLIGTPAYMSPEQADSVPDIDTRSDIYALGAILYELIADRPPFDPETLQTAGREEMRRIIREVRPSAPSRKSDGIAIARDLGLIALHSMEKEREHRYPTTTALAADVTRFLEHQPIHAHPISRAYHFSRWLRRNRLAAVASAAILTAAALILSQQIESAKQAAQANSLMKMLMVTTLWETDKIDYVALTEMRGVLESTAARIDAFQGTEAEKMKIRTGLGKAYYGLEEWDKATQHIGIAREIALRSGAPFRTARELQSLYATCLLYSERSDESLALTETLIPLYDKELTPDDPSRLHIRSIHAGSLAKEGRFKESLAAFDALFTLIKNWPNVPRPMDVVDARFYYPKILRRSGDPAGALKAARENVEIAKNGLGEVDVLYADVLVACAEENLYSGHTREALEQVKFAHKLYLDTYGPAHIRTREYAELLKEIEAE